MTTNRKLQLVPVDYTFSFCFLPRHLYNLQQPDINLQLPACCRLSYKDVEIRFTFCFRLQYVKDRFGQFATPDS